MVHSELVGGCHKLPAVLNYIHTPLSASASYTLNNPKEQGGGRTVGTKSQMISILVTAGSSTYDWLVGTCAEVLCLATSLGSSETGSL